MVATGVELVDGRRLNATKEIIISCGAFRTPQIQMLSGIGPPEVLKQFDVPLKVELPKVGQGLHDHIGIAQRWRLRPSIVELGFSKDHKKFDENPDYNRGSVIKYIAIASSNSGTLPNQRNQNSTLPEENERGSGLPR